MQELQERSGQTRRRLLGYVGYLTFHQRYQAEKRTLFERWLALPAPPPLPLRANLQDQPAITVHSGTPPPGDRLPDEVSLFLSDMGQFQRKWQLAQMVTWEFPMPQGPLLSVPLKMAAQLLGPDQLVSTSPVSYDAPSSEDEREAIRNQQKQAARMAGLSGDFPLSGLGGRGDDASAREDAFRLWLIEKTVRSRYGSPRGLVVRLMTAFEELLGCGQERIKQLRRLYLPFLGVPGLA
jgi:hypothetical protein